MKKILSFLFGILLVTEICFSVTYVDFNDGYIPTGNDFDANWTYGYWGVAVYKADTGGDDTYVMDVTPSPAAYSAGMIFHFKPTTANAGACSLEIESLGAKTIKKNVSDDLVTGDIEAGQIASVIYDGTNFQLLTRPNVATSSVNGLVTPHSDNFLMTGESLTIKDDGIIAEKISGLTGAGAIDSDNIPEGSTNLFFKGKVYSGWGLTEEANYTIIERDLRNTFIRFQILLTAWSDPSTADNFVPGAGGEGSINGGILSSVGNLSTHSVESTIFNTMSDNEIYASGIFYTSSGQADFGGTTDAAFPIGMIFDFTLDGASVFDSDVMLYCNNSTGYLRLHIGTINTLTDCALTLVIEELKHTALGDFTP